MNDSTIRERRIAVLDLPFGENEQLVLARWTANAPLAFIDQYVPLLRRYRAIAIDVAVRFQEHVIPFFSRTLSFEPAKR